MPVCLAGRSAGQRSPSERLLATQCGKVHAEALPSLMAPTNQRQMDRTAGGPGRWRAGCSEATIPTSGCRLAVESQAQLRWEKLRELEMHLLQGHTSRTEHTYALRAEAPLTVLCSCPLELSP